MSHDDRRVPLSKLCVNPGPHLHSKFQYIRLSHEAQKRNKQTYFLHYRGIKVGSFEQDISAKFYYTCQNPVLFDRT